MENEVNISTDFIENREELKELSTAKKVLETSLKLDQTYKLPVLNSFYNIGFQGYGYKFNDKQFYQLGGLQLQWNIFKGRDNKLKAKQATIDIEAIKSQRDDVSKQILLQVTTMYNQYFSVLVALRNINDEVLSTDEAFRLTQSRYLQGEALQIELIDARTQMTNAAINYSLAQLSVLVKSAALERAMATFPLQ